MREYYIKYKYILNMSSYNKKKWKFTDKDGSTFEYTFPKPTEVDSDIFLNENFGLGYRNLYLKEIYDYVKENPKWLSYLKTFFNKSSQKGVLKGLIQLSFVKMFQHFCSDSKGTN